MKKMILMTTASILAAGVAQAAIITSVTTTDITDAQVQAPTGMGVIKAVNFAGDAYTSAGGVTFEADSIVKIGDIVQTGNGYTATATVKTEGSGVLNSSFVNNDGDGFVVGNALTGLDTDTDYAFDLFIGTDHGSRNSTLNYAIGSESGSQAYDQVGVDLRRVRVEFNTGSDTEFNWNVGNAGGGFHSKMSGYAVYAVPEPATLGLLGAFGGAILFIRRRFKV